MSPEEMAATAAKLESLAKQKGESAKSAEEMGADLVAKLEQLARQGVEKPVEFVLGGVQFRLMLNSHFGGVPGTIWEYEADNERRFIIMDTDDDQRILIAKKFAGGDERAQKALALYDRLHEEGLNPMMSYSYKESCITVNCRFFNTTPPN